MEEEFYCKCRYQCNSFKHADREKLYLAFSLLDKIDQKTYLLSLIHFQNITRRRHGKYRDPSESRRQVTIKYTVPNASGQNIQVCSRIFKEIFRISAKEVQTLQKKKKKGCVVYSDDRGKTRSNLKDRTGHLAEIFFPAISLHQDEPETRTRKSKDGKKAVSQATIEVSEPSGSAVKRPHCNYWREEGPEERTDDSGDDQLSLEVCQPETLLDEKDNSSEEVEIALLRLRRHKLLLELEKLSEERERIIFEKRNIALHSDIVKLRLRLMECPWPTLTKDNSRIEGSGSEKHYEETKVSDISFSPLPSRNTCCHIRTYGSAAGIKSKSPGCSSVAGSSTLLTKQTVTTPPALVLMQTPSSSSSHPINPKTVIPETTPNIRRHFVASSISTDTTTSASLESPDVGLVVENCKSHHQTLPFHYANTSIKDDVLAISPSLTQMASPIHVKQEMPDCSLESSSNYASFVSLSENNTIGLEAESEGGSPSKKQRLSTEDIR